MRGIVLIHIILSCILLQAFHFEVEASAAGDRWRAAAKALMSGSSTIVPEPEAPQGFRNKAFYASANLMLDKGLNMLGTAYPAAKLATPVAKKIALPMIMKVHEKFAAAQTPEPKDQKSEVKTEPQPVLKKSGSFREKLKSLVGLDSSDVDDTAAKQVSDKKEKDQKVDKSTGDNDPAKETKQVNTAFSTSEMIASLKTKFRSDSKRFPIKHSPAAATNKSTKKANGSNDDSSHQNETTIKEEDNTAEESEKKHDKKTHKKSIDEDSED